MDRLHINSFTPAEVAERVADQPNWRISKRDIEYARDGLIDDLMDGKTVAGMDLGGLIDCAYNDDFKAVSAKLHSFFAGADHSIGDDRIERVNEMGKWTRELAEKWIDSRPDLIDERAAEIASWDE